MARYASRVRQCGAIDVVTGHGPADHICWVHDGEESWRAAAVPYLNEGVPAGDQLLYVADKPVDALVDDLADLPDRDALLGSGQLRVMSIPDAYGPTDSFTAERQVEAFHGEVLAAVDAGYRSLRLASEATALVQTPEQARRFAAYELLVDAMLARSALTALCGYDGSRISREAGDGLGFVHPLRHRGDRFPVSGLYAGDGGRWQLSGEVDLTVRSSLELALATLPDDAEVHLELGGLEFIDVAGVRALVALAERLAPGRRLLLHQPPTVLRRMFEIAWPGLPEALEIVA